MKIKKENQFWTFMNLEFPKRPIGLLFREFHIFQEESVANDQNGSVIICLFLGNLQQKVGEIDKMWTASNRVTYKCLYLLRLRKCSQFQEMSNKVISIGTEFGFIILMILLITMHYSENSQGFNVYTMRLILSWWGVAVNVLIILLHLVTSVIEFFRERRRIKAWEMKMRAIHSQNAYASRGMQKSQRARGEMNLSDDSQQTELFTSLSSEENRY